MVKRLVQYGDKLAIILDKTFLEELDISSDTLLEVSTDGKNIIFSPQYEKTEDPNIIQSLKKVNEKYGSVLKRLGE